SFAIRVGENQGVLKGSRLDQVATLSLRGVPFAPGKLTSTQGTDQLQMLAQGTTTASLSALKEGESVSARVALKDGRSFDLDALVLAPRPSVQLIGKSVQLSGGNATSNIVLTAADEL